MEQIFKIKKGFNFLIHGGLTIKQTKAVSHITFQNTFVYLTLQIFFLSNNKSFPLLLTTEGSPVFSTPSVTLTLSSIPLNIMALCSTHNVLKDRDIYFSNREMFQIRYFLDSFCVNNFAFLTNDKLLNDDRLMKILKRISYHCNDYKPLEYEQE